MKFPLVSAALLALVCVSGVSAQGGSTPAAAVPIGEAPVEGELRGAEYFSYEARTDGVMEVELTPTDGEVDLGVTHFSGSPAAESRRPGTAVERVALFVRAGDRFLIRVFSPLGVPARYRLSVALESIGGTEAPADVFVPQTARTGRSIEDAVEIPVRKVVPVEAAGDRYFRLRVPAGFSLEVALYTVSGDLDLRGWIDQGDRRIEVHSNRAMPLPEFVYFPLGSDLAVREIVIKVEMPEDMQRITARYGIVARLRHAGVTPEPVNLPDDEKTVQTAFISQGMGAGLPGGYADFGRAPGMPGAPKRVLLLP